MDQVRDEFARLAADLGSDDEDKRRAARRALDAIAHADQVVHVLALWPEEERKRRRAQRIVQIGGLICLVGFVLAMLVQGWFMRSEQVWEQTRPLRNWLHFGRFPFSLGVVALTFLVAERSPSALQKGMARLLTGLNDARLIGSLIDLRSFAWKIAKGEEQADELRAKVQAKLTRLLPRLGSGDVPALDDSRRKVLLDEVKHFARRLRKGDEASLNDDETAYLVAVLNALEQDAAAFTADSKTRAREEKAVARLALAEGAAEFGNGRRVLQAADDCLVRLRNGIGEGG